MLEKIKNFNSMDLIEQIEAIKSIITDANHLFLVDKSEEKCFIFLDDEKKNLQSYFLKQMRNIQSFQ